MPKSVFLLVTLISQCCIIPGPDTASGLTRIITGSPHPLPFLCSLGPIIVRQDDRDTFNLLSSAARITSRSLLERSSVRPRIKSTPRDKVKCISSSLFLGGLFSALQSIYGEMLGLTKVILFHGIWEKLCFFRQDTLMSDPAFCYK